MEVEGTTEGYFSSEPMEDSDQEPPKKCGSSGGGGGSANGCFDCNICLEFAVDPVVTLCGHLYCWPCIYKWLQVDNPAPQQCPVCKASLSENSLVPLYGRGHSTKQVQQSSISIPRRPSIPRDQISSWPTDSQSPRTDNHDYPPPVHRHHRHQHYHYPYDNMPSPPMGTRVIQSTAGGVIGGMAIAVLPWVFGNHEEVASMYYGSPYDAGSSGGSPRMRRQEREVERLLHQIWVFLFFCAVLCLLLF